MQAPTRFGLRIIGRFPAQLEVNEEHVSASVLSGPDDGHLSLSGTVTMTASEWELFVDALRAGLGGRLQIEDWTQST